MNSLVTALPGLVPIFVSAGGVNAFAGVLFYKNFEVSRKYWAKEQEKRYCKRAGKLNAGEINKILRKSESFKVNKCCF